MVESWKDWFWDFWRENPAIWESIFYAFVGVGVITVVFIAQSWLRNWRGKR